MFFSSELVKLQSRHVQRISLQHNVSFGQGKLSSEHEINLETGNEREKRRQKVEASLNTFGFARLRAENKSHNHKK